MKKIINDLDNIKNIELEIFDFDGFEFPKEILKVSKLRTLEIYGDNGYMKELPAEIENLINLKKLSIAVEILKCLPKEIGSLINLEYLEIDSEFEDFNGIPIKCVTEMNSINPKYSWIEENAPVFKNMDKITWSLLKEWKKSQTIYH